MAVSALLVALIALAALWPGLLARADPNAAEPVDALLGPSGAHWFGTDQLGRDVYSRVVHGARVSLFIGVGATGIALLLGCLIGMLAATCGRLVDEILMRITDVLLSFPGLLLALLVVAMLGPSSTNATIAIGLSSAPGFARLVRGEALAIREAGYVRTAVTFGAGRARVYLRHLLPNALTPLLVLALLSVGAAIIAGSSLSYLGLGPRVPTAEWGSMLAQGKDFLTISWAMAVFPGLAITVTVIAINIVGRDLQRRFEGRHPVGRF
ncbi:ABC transporter permease [Frankia sp. CNm7]|uniref:ABC transporter permease n=1 Tax=Frankia nepalensis TaxID=1836974 RepID=A0A937UTN4_9ACTN|nr:ABC transporter permease [Frankia nepalensis]MBL7518011.1 ABC transporter permease [Frankia nepalensis]MBL7633268.1 ABC transporter permease [Frankia nepalensis]